MGSGRDHGRVKWNIWLRDRHEINALVTNVFENIYCPRVDNDEKIMTLEVFIVQFVQMFMDQNPKVYVDASSCSVKSKAGFIQVKVYNSPDLGYLCSQQSFDELLKEELVSFME